MRSVAYIHAYITRELVCCLTTNLNAFTLRYRLFFGERWGLCAEAMERWDEALGLFERASALLLPGTALLKTSLAGVARARTNRDADRKVR